jgi:mannose/fructose/N-acetylgalactosamine-specific phosphotransferase system component IID
MSETKNDKQITQEKDTFRQSIEGSNNVQVAGENASVKITENHLSLGFDTIITALLVGILLFWLLVPYLESNNASFLSQICSSLFCFLIPIVVILDIYSLFRKKWLNLILGTLFIILTMGTILNY